MQTPMTLNEWLSYLGSIHVSAIDMGLERVLPVFKKLGIKKQAFVITVAGTNGKGSTTKLIAQICQASGLKTALYQSPHLVFFNERVQINGQPVSDKVLIDAFIEVEKARVACGLALSFFEMTTLAALWIFADNDCNVWVLEVGLGGRLDAVNMIDPNLCIITNVAIDHIDWLGDNKEKIGYEKAGILRQGVPLVYGEEQMPVSVQEAIKRLDVQCYHKSHTYDYKEDEQPDCWLYSSASLTMRLPKPDLALDNACTAVAAVLASKLSIDIGAIKQGLRTAKLPGRFDKRVYLGCHWVFDVAHNESGVHFLMNQFVFYWQRHKMRYPDARLQVIFSMLADKDIKAVLSAIYSYNIPIYAWHIAKINSPRAMPAEQMTGYLTTIFQNPIVYEYQTLGMAAKTVKDSCDSSGLVLVLGSFHTISESLIELESIKFD